MRYRLFAVCVLAVLLSSGTSSADVNVITTTQDLAALTREIGGDDVEVMSMALGQDPHFVNPKPSYLLKLR